MKLTTIQIQEISDKLEKQGIKPGFSSSREFIYFINKKHVSRFVEMSIFMRNNGIEMTWDSVSLMYRADVTIRRFINILLKPIELEIKSKLMYLVEFMNISFPNLIEGDFFEDFSNIKNYYVKSSRQNTVAYVVKKWVKFRLKGVYHH